MLTERREAIERLRRNCKELECDLLEKRLLVEEFDWRTAVLRESESASSLPFDGAIDVVLGSDLVWNSETARTFAAVVRVLLETCHREDGRPPDVFYGHWKRSPRFFSRFLESCANVGVVATFMPTDKHMDEAKDSPTEIDTIKADCTDDGEDWFNVIFEDDEGAVAEQLFYLCRLTLEERPTPGMSTRLDHRSLML